jgi:8-oxo-dGTP pyrophosphatase MutT (NUDIX family)
MTHQDNGPEYAKNPAAFVVEFVENPDFEQLPEKITAAFAFVMNDDKSLLVMQNERGWDIPGGHMEGDESVVQAAHREVLEEACVEIDDVAPFAVIKNDSTAMAIFTARPQKINTFIPDPTDPTSNRRFMNAIEFTKAYSGGDKKTMGILIDELVARGMLAP